ncbi:hypothetical protein [uncultured Sphingomonas sp.]|uniref:hypothetical protein n=1 Tax=uncultured Sphingomonas sp. TaxID=158754 RepID=UPI00374895CC
MKTDGSTFAGGEAVRAAAAMLGVRNMSVLNAGDRDDAWVRATFETLDDALIYRPQFVEAARERRLVSLLRSIAPAAARRAKALARVEAEDGVALVDALVEAAITIAGSTVGAVVATLLDGGSDAVRLSEAGVPDVKAWLSDGRLVCSFELNPQLRWTSERLVVRLELLEMVKDNLKGKSVTRIAQHPMLPAVTSISSCVTVDRECELGLRSATRVVARHELTDQR